MMKNPELAAILKERFIDHSVITTGELSDALIEIFPDVTKNTIAWRLNQLKKESLIFQTGRGYYSFNFKPEFTPELSLKSKRLYNRIKPYLQGELSMWEIQMLNEISDSNINRQWVFLSTNKEDLETLFNNMLDFSKQTFLQPDKDIIGRYVMLHDEAIILTALVSETPLFTEGEYTSPTLEGLLVNAWLKYENYLQPIGFDIEKIFSKAFEKYNVNQSKLLRYAARRDKRKEINELIKKLS